MVDPRNRYNRGGNEVKSNASRGQFDFLVRQGKDGRVEAWTNHHTGSSDEDEHAEHVDGLLAIGVGERSGGPTGEDRSSKDGVGQDPEKEDVGSKVGIYKNHRSREKKNEGQK